MNAEKSIMLHAFSDLQRVSSFHFLYLLRQYSILYKERGNASYRKIAGVIIDALRDVIRPTYLMECLKDLIYIVAPFGQLPTPLFFKVLTGLAQLNPAFAQDHAAKLLAADIFSNLILSGSFSRNKHVFSNLTRIFEFKIEELKDLQEVVSDREKFEVLKALLLKLIRSHRFCTASSVIERLGCPWEDFLEPLLYDDKPKLAEEWAASHHSQNHMISLLVKCYYRRKLFKLGLNILEKYNLLSEFPDAFYEYEESKMIKCAGKGRWDEARCMAISKMTLGLGKDDENDNVGMRLF